MDQSTQNGIISDVFAQNIVIFVGQWIESSLLKLIVNEVVAHIESQDQTWLLIKIFKDLYLFRSARGSDHHPAVGFTVWHLETVLEKLHCDLVSKRLTSFNGFTECCGLFAHVVSSAEVFAHLISVNIHKLILLGNVFSVFLELNTWWSHQNDLWWLSGRVALLKLQGLGHLLDNLLFGFVTVNFDNVALILVFDALDVDSVFTDRISGYLVKCNWVVDDCSSTAAINQLRLEILN